MADSSQIVAVDLPAAVGAGQPLVGTVTVRNTGDGPWNAAGPNPYKLGSADPQDNFVWGTNRLPLPADVPVGGEVTVPVGLTAPAAAGPFSCDWRMVRDNVAWFGPTAAAAVTVSAPPTLAYSDAVLPDPPADPMDLVSAVVCASGQVVMDNAVHVVRWLNQTGRTLWVRKAYVWTGVQQGVHADVHTQLTRGGEGLLDEPLAFLQWDRYAEPTAPNNSVWVGFDPYMALAPGRWIDMLFYANPFGVTGKLEESRAAIWALYAPEA